MAGLVPAIHVSFRNVLKQDVDARHKAGHDGQKLRAVHPKYAPPLTWMFCPVMKLAPGPHRKRPATTGVTARHWARVICSKACSARIAALLTRISMRPNFSAAAATILLTASASATSAVTASALPPAPEISRVTASASLRFARALTTT